MNKIFLTFFIFVSNIIFSQGDQKRFLSEYCHLPKNQRLRKLKLIVLITFGLDEIDNIKCGDIKIN